MPIKDGLTPIDITLLARDVLSEYEVKAGALEAPVPLLDGLLPVIGQRTGLQINRVRLPWSGSKIRAKVDRYGDHANIFYSSDLNICEARLAICKEAVHLLCGQDSNYTDDVGGLIRDLVNDVPQGISEEVDIERLAVYGAMELLIPSSLRDTLYDMEASGMSDYEIALHYRVPEDIIKVRLAPAIRKFTDNLNDNMA